MQTGRASRCERFSLSHHNRPLLSHEPFSPTLACCSCPGSFCRFASGRSGSFATGRPDERVCGNRAVCCVCQDKKKKKRELLGKQRREELLERRKSAGLVFPDIERESSLFSFSSSSSASSPFLPFFPLVHLVPPRLNPAGEGIDSSSLLLPSYIHTYIYRRAGRRSDG